MVVEELGEIYPEETKTIDFKYIKTLVEGAYEVAITWKRKIVKVMLK